MAGREDDDADGTGRTVQPTRGVRAQPATSDSATRTIAAQELLGPAGILRIDLDGEVYTLRLTRNHRLILTK